MFGVKCHLLCVCQMTKEIAAGPDSFNFIQKVLCVFWRWFGVCV